MGKFFSLHDTVSHYLSKPGKAIEPVDAQSKDAIELVFKKLSVSEELKALILSTESKTVSTSEQKELAILENVLLKQKPDFKTEKEQAINFGKAISRVKQLSKETAYQSLVVKVSKEFVAKKKMLLSLVETTSVIDPTLDIGTLSSDARELYEQYKAHINDIEYKKIYLYCILSAGCQAEEFSEPYCKSAELQALKLTIIFGNSKSALDYLKSFANQNEPGKTEKDFWRDSDYVKGATDFSLPTVKPEYFAHWNKLAKAKIQDLLFRKVLAAACKYEAYFNKLLDYDKPELKTELFKQKEAEYSASPKQEDKKKLKTLQKILAKVDVKLKKRPSMQEIFSCLDETDIINLHYMTQCEAINFLRQQGLYREVPVFEKLDRTRAGVNIPTSFEIITLPHRPGFYLRRLDVANNKEHAALAASLGKIQGNCQFLGAKADKQVKYGLTSPNAAFFVLAKGDPNNPSINDDVIAQSLAIRAKDGGLIFDSLEIIGLQGKRKLSLILAKRYKNIAYNFFSKLILELKKDFSVITLGTNLGLVYCYRDFGYNLEFFQYPYEKGVKLYDAKREQYTLYHHKVPFLRNNILHRIIASSETPSSDLKFIEVLYKAMPDLLSDRKYFDNILFNLSECKSTKITLLAKTSFFMKRVAIAMTVVAAISSLVLAVSVALSLLAIQTIKFMTAVALVIAVTSMLGSLGQMAINFIIRASVDNIVKGGQHTVTQPELGEDRGLDANGGRQQSKVIRPLTVRYASIGTHMKTVNQLPNNYYKP